MHRTCLLLVPLAVTGLLTTMLACNGRPSPELPVVQAPNQLSIQNARLRAVPPGARVSAAYLEITRGHDDSAEAVADRLLAARMLGDFAGARVEIHSTIVDGEGVMRMRPIPADEGLPIPLDQSTVLKPGGFHLMIFELPREPAMGEVVNVELRFAKAGPVQVPFRVFDGDTGNSAHHSAH